MKSFITLLFITLSCSTAFSSEARVIDFAKSEGAFALHSAPLYASPGDFPGVLRALKDLQADIGKVSGKEPSLATEGAPSGEQAVLVGSLGHSALIDALVKRGKLDASDLKGKWESFVIQVIEDPLPGLKRALVIAGSDKRGAIYGIYEISRQIGVSPWEWWADVPPQKHEALFVLPGRHRQGEPSVKYRGIFLNDEEPCLGRWVTEKFGGFKHPFYEKVFELLLRLKANYLWPAMWWASFNSDDPLNPKLADEYGIVMSTSHHEPMMRAHAEWTAFKDSKGPWNYAKNEAVLKDFWREGVRRMGAYESVVTLAMRGDGDMAMTEGTNIALLEKIVKDQRQILTEETGKDPKNTPQVWALYKEVQDYYDKGMRVPEDITLLLSDDNWGNLRKLPNPDDAPRSGGYGIYYHFDYVGGPRNYKWLNTNSLPRVWEQMRLAKEYGADRIWIVNVGDLKPMELPITFFLDYAWDSKAWNQDNLGAYTKKWAEEQFGAEHAAEIAELLDAYTKFNARRKHELLSPDTFSLVHYNEAESVIGTWKNLAEQADKLNQSMPAAYKDAYQELVLHPILASATLNELYFSVAKNRLYASQGRISARDWAAEAKKLFSRDSLLSRQYNSMAGGKWNHMMDQTHISYTNWQQPEKDVLPELKGSTATADAKMGVALEGSDLWWPKEKGEAMLPEIDSYNRQSRFIEIFNRGNGSFNYEVKNAPAWLKISPRKGVVIKEQNLTLSVDWDKAPAGRQKAPITILASNGKSVAIQVPVHHAILSEALKSGTFVESEGCVSMEAEHFTNKVETKTHLWKVLPGLGRTLSGVSVIPSLFKGQTPKPGNPRLEYAMQMFSQGDVRVYAYLSPTLNFNASEGLRYGVSFDDQPIQIINLHQDKSLQAWEKSVSDNILISESRFKLTRQGVHVLKFWLVDPGVLLQKLVVDLGEVKSSYLGPPESYRLP